MEAMGNERDGTRRRYSTKGEAVCPIFFVVDVFFFFESDFFFLSRLLFVCFNILGVCGWCVFQLVYFFFWGIFVCSRVSFFLFSMGISFFLLSDLCGEVCSNGASKAIGRHRALRSPRARKSR